MFLLCQTSCASGARGVYCVVGVGGADRAAGAVGVQETTRPLLIVEQIVQRVRRRPDRRAVAGVGRAAGSQSCKEGGCPGRPGAPPTRHAAADRLRLLVAATDRRPRR